MDNEPSKTPPFYWIMVVGFAMLLVGMWVSGRTDPVIPEVKSQSVWADPETGCLYNRYVYEHPRVGEVTSLSMRFDSRGLPDCPQEPLP